MANWTTMFPGRSRTEPQVVASRSTRSDRKVRLACDHLEGRELLTAIGAGGGVGVDYTLMGGQWDDSKPISFSIADDGAVWDGGTNDVNAQLDAEFGGSSWRNDGSGWRCKPGQRRPTSTSSLRRRALCLQHPGAEPGRLPVRRHPGRWLRLGHQRDRPDLRPPAQRLHGGRRREAQHLLHLRPDRPVGSRNGPDPRARPLARPRRVAAADVDHVQLLQRGPPRPERLRRRRDPVDLWPAVADQFQAKGQATSPASAVDSVGTLNRSRMSPWSTA